MNSKEIIKRLVDHDSPVRFGYDFADKDYNDLMGVPSRSHINIEPNPYNDWGKYPELLEKTGFKGEVRTDYHGNIYGRFEGKTKGECIKGVIDTWENIDNYRIPQLDKTFRDKIKSMNYEKCDKYVFTSINSIFSQLRDARLIDNALADTVLEEDNVIAFLDRTVGHEIEAIKIFAGCGIDAALIGDDWGTQTSTFISPESFRRIFKPYYKKIADELHNGGMKLFMHSCGYNYGFIEDLIEAGVDVFQFDQPDAYPSETLAEEFASRVCFWSPVDVQKVLPTGDREFIEQRALAMCNAFKKAGGGFIAKDYPTYEDIDVKLEWAKWARDIIVANSAL